MPRYNVQRFANFVIVPQRGTTTLMELLLTLNVHFLLIRILFVEIWLVDYTYYVLCSIFRID